MRLNVDAQPLQPASAQSVSAAEASQHGSASGAQPAPMRRIVILGCAGSGKSTLARLLGERLAMPVFHLDQMFWQPGWVIEGNYDQRTFKWRLPRADTLIWMDTPRMTCVRRVLGRTWRGVRGEQRADMAPGCAEAFDAAYLALWRNTCQVMRAPERAPLLHCVRSHAGQDDSGERSAAKRANVQGLPLASLG